MLSYIADVLCDLVGDGAAVEEESSFDVELFFEMVSAYVPEFSSIER